MAKLAFTNESTYKRFVEQGKESEFDALFDKAVEEAKRSFGKTHPMFVGGKEVVASEKIEEKSPIDGTIIGYFQKGTREHARMAIEAARKASATWRLTDYRERVTLFRKAADVFSKHKFLVSAILSYENGKSRYESVGEVDGGHRLHTLLCE